MGSAPESVGLSEALLHTQPQCTSYTSFFVAVLLAYFVFIFLVGAIGLSVRDQSPSVINVNRPYASRGPLDYFLEPEQVTLTWENVVYTVKSKRKKKVLLNGVSGIARPGTMTALMGPSGAGKTTLLDVLAGMGAIFPLSQVLKGCTSDAA